MRWTLQGNRRLDRFFDEWVYGTEVPKYHFRYQLNPEDAGKVRLHMHDPSYVPYSSGDFMWFGRAILTHALSVDRSDGSIPMSASGCQIWGPSAYTTCLAVFVSALPSVQEETRAQLFHFNFSCMTRWTVCTDKEDIMPVLRRPVETAWVIGKFAGHRWPEASKFPICMVRRVNAREKFRTKESLRKCIRPVGGEQSPGHDEIRRVPVLQNASAV